MTYSLYIILGLIPSAVWLLFYLRKDSHPESSSMILKIFFYGMIAAVPVALIEIGFQDLLRGFEMSELLYYVVYLFLGVAFFEEFIKFLVVRGKVLTSAALDEPVDVMLYMIIAALGFAAAENILILFSLGPTFLIAETISITAFRFIGATFLHALCSGLVGFFLALSFYQLNKRNWFLALGLVIATLLHGLYNFSIIRNTSGEGFIIPLLILISLAAFVTFAFKQLKKIKSICKI